MTIEKITQSDIHPLDQVDKINEIIDWKQDKLIAGDNLSISSDAPLTTLTVTSSNPNSTVTNNYTGTKETLGTLVETYRAVNTYGYKFDTFYVNSNKRAYVLNATTGIASHFNETDTWLNIWLYTYANSVNSAIFCFIMGSNLTGTQVLAFTLDTNLKLSEIPSFSTLTAGSLLYIKVQRVAANQIRYSSSRNGTDFTIIKTATGGSGNTQEWVQTGKDAEGHYGHTNTIDCTRSSVFSTNGNFLSYFVISDTSIITGTEWTFNGVSANLPQGVTVTDVAAGDVLTCTFVTTSVTKIETIGETHNNLHIYLDGESEPANRNFIYLHNPAIDIATTPAETQYSQIVFSDVNNHALGALYCRDDSAGKAMVMSIYKIDQSWGGGFQLLRSPANVISCSFPQTACCDGQWYAIPGNQVILNNASLTASSDVTKTVTLPNDGHVYEVMIRGGVTTGSSSGNYMKLHIHTNAYGNTAFICSARTRSNSTVGSEGTVVIPMKYGSGNLTIGRNTSYNGTADLTVMGFRRVGTNT